MGNQDDPHRTAPAGTARQGVSRRTMLKATGGVATAMATLEMVGRGAWIPDRIRVAEADAAASATLPDIQFDIGGALAPVRTVNGVQVRFGPVHTAFLTLKLRRTPTASDRAELNRALDLIEANYPFSPSGVFTFVAYGRSYFDRLPGGIDGPLVGAHMPRLAFDHSRSVLEEAVPGSTDVSMRNPGVSKLRYGVPVRIEDNDMLVTLRSDNALVLLDVIGWLAGDGFLRGRMVRSPALRRLVTFTSSRAMFQQVGLPRFVASVNRLPFADFINDRSPMWMGFSDQQTNAGGPAAITTFAGNASAHLTTAVAGDYFDNGSVQHLSHDIIDMLQWFDMADADAAPGQDGVFTERVQYMFHSPAIDPGNADQFTNGGGPSFLPNDFHGPDYAARTAAGIGTQDNEHRMGHLSTLQRSSRAADGTPVHIRMDGPGFDDMDVPDGSNQPKLQFTVFMPSADSFATMRDNAGAQDLCQRFGVDGDDNGLERFITATRRQNFLVPPRRHRAFPLLELT
ncbi:MAG TPA: hypothetical protein VFX70_04710 [Mycobacteriales bacterium]|nr:hypothetical protein [Mycobacteriales bacterium]